MAGDVWIKSVIQQAFHQSSETVLYRAAHCLKKEVRIRIRWVDGHGVGLQGSIQEAVPHGLQQDFFGVGRIFYQELESLVFAQCIGPQREGKSSRFLCLDRLAKHLLDSPRSHFLAADSHDQILFRNIARRVVLS